MFYRSVFRLFVYENFSTAHKSILRVRWFICSMLIYKFMGYVFGRGKSGIRRE